MSHNPPRPYDISKPSEIRRLHAETLGYLRTCLTMGHGSDLKGRRFAMVALEELIEKAKAEPQPAP